MVKIGVFVRHKVKDYAKWRKVFRAHAEMRRAGGEKEYWISHIAGQLKNLCVFLEWASSAKAKKNMNGNSQLKNRTERLRRVSCRLLLKNAR